MPDALKILSIDTSTRIQAIGLVHGTVQVARHHHLVPRDHSSTLLQNISTMLGQQGWSAADLDLVACGLGPGSFTGLRVGMANAKGLARAADAAIVGVSTLASIARPVAALHQGWVVSAIDARRGEVYAAVYRVGNDIEIEHVDRAWQPEALASAIEDLSAQAPVCLVGDGFRAHSLFQDLEDPQIKLLDAAWDSPSPFSTASIGRRIYQDRGGDDLVTLEPNYIRLSDAEISWQARSLS